MIGECLADRYQVTEKLGAGGMGQVFRAFDSVLARQVAVKVIPPAQLTQEVEKRFAREARLVARLDHPAILPIYDFGRHDQATFFVMPLIHGAHLRDFQREHPLGLQDVLDIAIAVADALAYSHERGIVHRDVKPENILVSFQDGRRRVWVTDFGIARDLSEPGLTHTGAILGTISYASPEQLEGGQIDACSDVFSFGTVLWECLAGKPLFRGNLAQVVAQITQQPVPSLLAARPDLDPALTALVHRCLERERELRFANGLELVAALRGFSELPLAASHGSRFAVHDERRSAGVEIAFVGRRAELDHFDALLPAVVGGELRLTLVGGVAGSGKSRLLDEVERRARAQGLRVFRARFFEDEQTSPYQGFCELIHDYYRRRDRTGDTTGPADLHDLAPGLVRLFPSIADTFQLMGYDLGGALDAAPGRPEPAERADPSAIFDLLARTLIRLAKGRPMALLLEDLQGAEVSLEALRYIVPRLGGSPVLMVGTYRSEEVERGNAIDRLISNLHGRRNVSVLQLQAFEPEVQRLLVAELLGRGEVTGELDARLYEATRGNAFLTVELVRWLRESGAVAMDDGGRWRLTPDFEMTSARLPTTLQDAVLKRLDRLPDDVREVLATASVLGRDFEIAELEAIVDDRDRIDDAVDRLIEEGLWMESRHGRAERIAFASGLVRDVAYAGLSRRQRRRLHRVFAEHLEARAGARDPIEAGRWDPLLAHHYGLGDVADKAVPYALRAARRSLASFGGDEAARSCRLALELVDDEWRGDPRARAEIHDLLARALYLRGELDGSLRAAETAYAAYAALGLDLERVELAHRAATAAWNGRQSDHTREWTERGIEVARRAGVLGTWRELLRLGATVANLRGDGKTAAAYLEEADQLEQAAAQEQPAESAAEVEAGGSLVVALSGAATSLDPVLLATTEDAEILGNLFETLIGIDRAGNLVPRLAQSWTLDGEQRTIELDLRPGVTFHDESGLDAAAVKASFEGAIRRLGEQALRSPYAEIEGARDLAAGRIETLPGIEVCGGAALRLRLAQPTPIYPALLSRLEAAITRPAGEPAQSEMPFHGTGPFRLVAREPRRLLLQRHPTYRLPQEGIETLDFRLEVDTAASAARLREGTFDVVRNLSPTDAELLLRDPRWREGTYEAQLANTYFGLFRVPERVVGAGAIEDSAPLTLRAALIGALDVSELVLCTLGRWARPATGVLPPGLLGHDPDRRQRPWPEAELRQRLSQLGSDLRLRVLVDPMLRNRYDAFYEALVGRWRELGIAVETHGGTPAEYLEGLARPQDFDLVLRRWSADYADPDSFFYEVFNARSGLLRDFYQNDQVDQAIEQARRETDPARRAKIYRDLETQLLDDCVLLPLFHGVERSLLGHPVHGLSFLAWPPYASYHRVARARTIGESTARAGVLRVPMAARVEELDPDSVTTVEQAEVVPLIFETLTRDLDGSNIAPWLAQCFAVEELGHRYRFRLRQDVCFHDGRPLSSRDVRYSFERALRRPGGSGRYLLAGIRGARDLVEGRARELVGVRLLSDHELTIDLEEPIGFFPSLLTHMSAAILPEGHVPAEHGEFFGTGPFRILRFNRGELLELEAHRRYWRPKLPRCQRLVFHFGIAPDEIHRRFVDGFFAIGADFFPKDVERLLANAELAPGYREAPRLTTYFLAFNTRRGKLGDAALRHRVVRAVERKQLVAHSLGRLAMSAGGLIPPGLLGHLDAPRTSIDPASSKSDVVRLRAVLHPIFFAEYADFTQRLIRQLQHHGIHLDVINQGDPGRQHFDQVRLAGEADLLLGRWIADYPDPDTYAYGMLHSRHGYLGALCGSEALDAVAESGRTQTDPAIRRTLYEEMEELIVREAVLLPIFYEQEYRFGRPEVQGFDVTLSKPVVPYEKLSLRGK